MTDEKKYILCSFPSAFMNESLDDDGKFSSEARNISSNYKTDGKLKLSSSKFHLMDNVNTFEFH